MVIDVIGASPAVYDYLTVPLFQANPATGTMALCPEATNDNDTGLNNAANAIGEYAEIDFGKALYFQQYRQNSCASNVGDGRWKIQYWNGSVWVDWIIDIIAYSDVGWQNWVYGSLVSAQKIRLVCTTVDSENMSRMCELEMKY